jgi:hypothetical protein
MKVHKTVPAGGTSTPRTERQASQAPAPVPRTARTGEDARADLPVHNLSRMSIGPQPGRGEPPADPRRRRGASANNTGLPNRLKAGVENLSGFAMDDVKVHFNSSKPAALRALAYTQGTDIHVAPGQEKHLPHEAWHVVQQKQGRVKPTLQMKGKAINDDAGLEREADAMGHHAQRSERQHNAVRGDRASEPAPTTAASAAPDPALQRKIKGGAKVFDQTLPHAAQMGQPIANMLANNATYLTDDSGALKLDYGMTGKLKILSPDHHLIGEQHNASSLKEIEAAWGAIVPIFYESRMPDIAGPGIKAKAPDAKADAKDNKEEKAAAEPKASVAKPLENVNARAIYTMENLFTLAEKAKTDLQAERQTIVECLAWLAVTFDDYKKVEFDAAAIFADQTGKGAVAYAARVHRIRDHTKNLIAGLATLAQNLKDGSSDLKPLAKLVTSLKPIQSMFIADVQEDKPQSQVVGGNKPSKWNAKETSAPMFQDLKSDREPTHEPHYKYNALREEYMVRNILGSAKPSLAIMGQAHLRSIQADWNSASFVFHIDAKAFEEDITVVAAAPADAKSNEKPSEASNTPVTPTPTQSASVPSKPPNE